VHEEKSHGLADDVASAENGGVGAFDKNVAAAEDFHAAGGGTGDEAGTAADEAAKADGMKSVDVLGGVDGFEDALGIDLRRKRELYEDAIYLVVAVQAVDESEHVLRGDRLRRRVEETGEAEFLASGDFALHVELRGRIFADEDGSEARLDASGGEGANFVLQFGENFIANLEAIEDACGHETLAFTERKQIITHAKTVTGDW
jgi:hypothetical protein